MQALILAIGGVGVFLLGMVVMTEGLKTLAGARINQWLAEATRSPWSGATTGAVGTAILQSSSATTVAAVAARELDSAVELAQISYRRTLELEDPQREKIYQAVVRGDIDLRYATECAEALRWLTRVSRHISRICHYLLIANQAIEQKKETPPKQG